MHGARGLFDSRLKLLTQSLQYPRHVFSGDVIMVIQHHQSFFYISVALNSRIWQLFVIISKSNISKFQFNLDYCQALYHEPLAREIVQALPVLLTLNKLLYFTTLLLSDSCALVCIFLHFRSVVYKSIYATPYKCLMSTRYQPSRITYTVATLRSQYNLFTNCKFATNVYFQFSVLFSCIPK